MTFLETTFLEIYRKRPDLPHQYGPALVPARSGRFLDPDVYELDSDEMGRSGCRPLMSAFPLRPAAYRTLVDGDRPTRSATWRHEIRLVDPTEDELRDWRAAGFDTVYVRRAMECRVPDGASGTAQPTVLPSLADRPEMWPEFTRLANDAFGIALSEAEFARQSSPPWWRPEDVLFSADDAGTMRASAQLIVDQDAAGERYGVVRALAVDPAVRQQNSIAMLLGVHQSLLARLRQHGATRAYVQADEDNAGLRRLYAMAGYREVARVVTLWSPRAG